MKSIFDGVLTLNDTAEFIWHMLEKGVEAEEIITSLAAECNVSEDEIKEDVYDFIGKLKKTGIVE